MDRQAAPERILHAIALFVVASLIGLRVFVESLRHLFSAWPDFRLGFSGLLAHGLDLYPKLGTGPIVGDIYGPVAAIFYLPPLLGPTITADIWLAELWTTIAVGGLLVAICLMRSRRNGLGLHAGACVALAALGVMLALPGMSHCLIQVHADAPALFFGALSCVVWRGATQFDLRRSIVSALLFSVAVSSKQSAIFILGGQFPIVWLRHGPRNATLHAALSIALVVGVAIAVSIAIGVDPKTMWFYLVTVPSKHEFVFSDRGFLLARMATICVPTFAMLGILAAVWPRSEGEAWLSALSPTRDDWMMLAATGLAMTPISFLATIKVGGYLNNLHSHYYFLLACCLALLDAFAAIAPGARKTLRRTLSAAALSSLMLLPNDPSAEVDEVQLWLNDVSRNPNQIAYDYLLDHYDAYFPWHTLAVLEARGRSYTAFDGLRTLDLAGFHVNPLRIQGAIPEDVHYVVLPNEGRGIQGTLDQLHEFFPRFHHLRQPPAGLECFIVFER